MKIFLDTNVILEYFTVREDYLITQRLFELAQKAGCEILITFNVSDYPSVENIPVRVVTPLGFLSEPIQTK